MNNTDTHSNHNTDETNIVDNTAELNQEPTTHLAEDNTINQEELSDSNAVNNNNNSNKTNKSANKKEKIPFIEACNHCHKNFKSKVTFDKHIYQQTCYGQHEITFCKTCSIKLNTRDDYIKHIMTSEHLSSINFGRLEKIKDDNADKPASILTADPYLNKREAILLGTRNLGNKYTFIFENDRVQEVKLVHQPEPVQQQSQQSQQNIQSNSHKLNYETNNVHQSPSQSPVQFIDNAHNANNANNTNNIKNVSASRIGHAPDKNIQPTERQKKLLLFLEKQNNPLEASNMLLKMLDNKLHIEDYYGITTIIRENHIFTLEIKQALLGLINNFVEGLTKKRAGGLTTYKDKDIAKMVIGLSM